MIFKAYPEEQSHMRWITIIMTAIATLLLFCRIMATVKNRGWLGVEDAFVIAANICLILLATCMYIATTYGFGKRIADIKESGGDVKKALKYFWMTFTFYTLTNGFNKMAFIALYYRVFPMKGFRQACLVLGVISLGWTVSFLFVGIFQCNPIDRVYDRKIPGTCISFAAHRWSNASLNLLTDLAIFILPMPVIMRLNMSFGSKIGLVILFSMGFFICLTTALRMATLLLSLHTKEPTYESAPANLWSFIEAATGVICACLISLRKTVGSMWPKRWRSSKGSSRHYQQYGSGVMGSHGMTSRLGHGTRTGNNFPLSDMKNGARGPADAYRNISPSESQEQIIKGGKVEAHITTKSRPESSDGSDNLIMQGITVTTDVKIVRD
ncbi:hypothetical protein HBI49_140190 [Parastagonospora nodorum]|nr:hypothetical protein HBI49_140190 [Parastagonospora nodorum]KAH5631876.1 hypothetical protein HBI51_191440 [Parastagonospora nodorum]